MDGIGATAVPLIDCEIKERFYKDSLMSSLNTNNSDKKESNTTTFVHFRNDVTFSTCRRGFFEGEINVKPYA